MVGFSSWKVYTSRSFCFLFPALKIFFNVAGPRKGQYLTHAVLDNGTGKAQADKIYEVLQEFNSTDTLMAVACDNTSTNTGHNHGVVVELEKRLQRKVHKIGCLLHWNELPLRQVIGVLDGNTHSATKWSGPICSRLNEDLHQEEPVAFDRVSSPLQRPPEEILNTLSRDQRLLLENVLAVSSGEWTIARFTHSKAGPPNSARWLTLAIRILILYTRTAEPTEELRRIVGFIQKVYAPGWFKIKMSNDFLEGPRILFEILQEARALNDPLCLEIVIDKLQNWAFPLQADNFLASVLFCPHNSPPQWVKLQAALRILDIRSENQQNPHRALTSKAIPPINTEAREWFQPIQLSQANYEPPWTCKLTPVEVEELPDNPGERPCFPLHTQTVERSVKATTESSTISWNWESRHQAIIVTAENRAKMPRMDTKKDLQL